MMTTRACRGPARVTILLAVLLLALLTVGPAAAGEKDAGERGGEGREVKFAGMVLSIDPQTGRLQAPDGEQVRKLRAAMREMFAKMRASRQARPGVPGEAPAAVPEDGAMVPREDGVTAALVGTDHLNFTVVSVGPDGEISTHCLNGMHDEAGPADPPAETE